MIMAIIMLVSPVYVWAFSEENDTTQIPDYITGETHVSRISTDKPIYTSFEELRGKTIGSLNGAMPSMVDAAIKNYDLTVEYYNSFADTFLALKTGKVDAVYADEPIILYYMCTDDEITAIDKYDCRCGYGYLLPRNEDGAVLRNKINSYLDELKKSGELEELQQKWFYCSDYWDTVIDYKSLPDTNGTIKVGVYPQSPPYTIYINNYVTGYEMEILYGFCKKMGYKPDISIIDSAAITSSLGTRVDMVFGGICILDERKESAYFSDSIYDAGVVFGVLKDGVEIHSEYKDSIVTSVKNSFMKTFIREDRYKLFTGGLFVTLAITIVSTIVGGCLGLVFYEIRHRKKRAGTLIINAIERFMENTPMVVILMVLYYCVFKKVAIDGIFVAMIGFSVYFAGTVDSLLKVGVSAVGLGQYEAAIALGFTSNQAYRKVILPQAVFHIMPRIKSQVIGLFKGTAIVGYIAVQDLTRVSDMVRSRTYEAFFPLVATAVIYYLCALLIALIFSKLLEYMEPKNRPRKKIVSGIKAALIKDICRDPVEESEIMNDRN